MRGSLFLDMHNDPNVTRLVVASAENRVHKIQDACKSIPFTCIERSIVDNNRSGNH